MNPNPHEGGSEYKATLRCQSGVPLEIRFKRGEIFSLAVALGLFAAGCHKHVPAPPPPVVRPPQPPALSPEGTWQSTTRKGITMSAVFKPNGSVEFQNGLAFYNPGHWEYDP